MLDRPGVDLRDRRLSLGGSSAVLVEFPRMMVPPNASEELFRLRMSGVVPVLAHPERYWGCTVERVEEWRRVGAVIQTDVAGVFASGPQGALATSLLERGFVDLLASDTHGDSRALLPARKWLISIALYGWIRQAVFGSVLAGTQRRPTERAVSSVFKCSASLRYAWPRCETRSTRMAR